MPKVTVWDPAPTPVTSWGTWGAGSQLTSPPWLPSMVQVAAARNVTVAPSMDQSAEVDWSMESATGKPEVAVAVTL